jgi:PHD/YefM family antitoxin component YafN of YafNO toxin-antitoxin module
MITLHPEILKKNGKEEFAILNIEEYNSLIEYLEDLEDLVDLRKAKEENKNEPSISLEETEKILGLTE